MIYFIVVAQQEILRRYYGVNMPPRDSFIDLLYWFVDAKLHAQEQARLSLSSNCVALSQHKYAMY